MNDIVLREGGIWERLYPFVTEGMDCASALAAAGLPDRPGWRDLYEWVLLDAHDDELGYPPHRTGQEQQP